MDFWRGSEWRQWDLHVHTASSYDSKYNGNDSNEILCKSLIDNEISAVAITDHFLIDANRIQNLRKLAPEITFFPGVELRTDRGATNVHVILIFSENSNLEQLSEDMNVFRRQANNHDDDDSVTWSYEKILEFAREHNALISIHAGRKSSGIDDKIKVTNKVANAIKDTYAESVDLFEIGQTRDIMDFKEKVLPDLEEKKPLILCSDNHDPRNYERKDYLWIKADLTFEGLQQVVLQPDDRVYIGVVPPSMDRVNKNKQNYISSVRVNRVENPHNVNETWFNFELPLNSGMVSIIGNKGSGKSALSDIIGYFSNCKTMNKASFLNEDRFRKKNKSYAQDYEGYLTWYDGQKDKISNLQESKNSSVLENAQYLPQRYIEDVCNDLDTGFKDEINHVIFSYVDPTEKGNTSNLEQLIQQKSAAIQESIDNKLKELESINDSIITIEDKLTKVYYEKHKDGQKKCEERLERHIKNKPKEVKKNSDNENPAYLEKLDELNCRIDSINEQIDNKNERLTEINVAIDDLKITLTRVINIEKEIKKINSELETTSEIYKIDELKMEVNSAAITKKIGEYIDSISNEKEDINKELGNSKEISLKVSLKSKLESAIAEKKTLISNSDDKEKAYQKYIEDLNQWEEQKANIIGDSVTPDTLEFYKNEVEYIEKYLAKAYDDKCKIRLDIVKEIFNLKLEISQVYTSIYAPVEEQLDKLIGDMEDKIEFVSEISLVNMNIGNELLEYINKSYAGIFNGTSQANSKMTSLIKETEFNNWESTKSFIVNIIKVVTEDRDVAAKKVKDRNVFYEKLFGLKYISAQYNLKMGGRSLNELSPGEKGIVLLIFYLALNKDDRPIIIDQPEDNLDNQSVYNKLVKCIKEAKKKRQVIIVTHNPNIAIACDSEQLIYCFIDKTINKITYSSGSIENPKMRKHVIDVLEGTMPAFELRRKKYNVNH